MPSSTERSTTPTRWCDRLAIMRKRTKAVASASSAIPHWPPCMRVRHEGLPVSRSWTGMSTMATAQSRPSTPTRPCSPSRSIRTTTTRRVRARSQTSAQNAGEGFNINVPLPPGSGVGAYVATFEHVVAPALNAYRPEMILIASGLDASAMDPLGSMMMTSDGYRKLTQIVLAVARDVCGGRLVACHEGGYSPAYVPYCGLAVLEELAGQRTGLEDPFLSLLAGFGGQEIQPHQQAVVREAAKLVARLVG